MDRKIRYFVNGWSFRLSFATRPGYDGDHEDISDGDSYELGDALATLAVQRWLEQWLVAE